LTVDGAVRLRSSRSAAFPETQTKPSQLTSNAVIGGNVTPHANAVLAIMT
jgi:hypothetical protein